MPVDPYVEYKSKRLVKLTAVFSGSSSMMAIFNTSAEDVSELISLSDFAFSDSKEKRKFIVRQYSTGKVFGPASAPEDTMISAALEPAGWDFLTAVPVIHRDGWELGVLGFVSQLAGGAAVTGCSLRETGSDYQISVTLKALGVLGKFSIPSFFYTDLTKCRHLYLGPTGQKDRQDVWDHR